MALIECPECKKEISSKAESCPHCGMPISMGFADSATKIPEVVTVQKTAKKWKNLALTIGTCIIVVLVWLIWQQWANMDKDIESSVKRFADKELYEKTKKPEQTYGDWLKNRYRQEPRKQSQAGTHAAGETLTGRVPKFNTGAYCKQIAEVTGSHSYSLEKSCLQMEKAALDSMLANILNVPNDILEYCAEIGSVTGNGSYSLMQSCIQMEMDAKNSLHQK